MAVEHTPEFRSHAPFGETVHKVGNWALVGSGVAVAAYTEMASFGSGILLKAGAVLAATGAIIKGSEWVANWADELPPASPNFYDNFDDD